MECKKCGGKKIKFATDARGIVDGYCKECGTHIKKVGASEVLDYLKFLGIDIDEKEKPAEIDDLRPSSVSVEGRSGALCPYCTEHYAIIYPVNVRTVRPIEHDYCPICGRKTTPQDRDY